MGYSTPNAMREAHVYNESWEATTSRRARVYTRVSQAVLAHAPARCLPNIYQSNSLLLFIFLKL